MSQYYAYNLSNCQSKYGFLKQKKIKLKVGRSKSQKDICLQLQHMCAIELTRSEAVS